MFNFFQRVLKEINKKFLNFFRFLNWKNIFKNVGILIVVLVMVFLGGVKNGEAKLISNRWDIISTTTREAFEKKLAEYIKKLSEEKITEIGKENKGYIQNLQKLDKNSYWGDIEISKEDNKKEFKISPKFHYLIIQSGLESTYKISSKEEIKLEDVTFTEEDTKLFNEFIDKQTKGSQDEYKNGIEKNYDNSYKKVFDLKYDAISKIEETGFDDNDKKIKKDILGIFSSSTEDQKLPQNTYSYLDTGIKDIVLDAFIKDDKTDWKIEALEDDKANVFVGSKDNLRFILNDMRKVSQILLLKSYYSKINDGTFKKTIQEIWEKIITGDSETSWSSETNLTDEQIKLTFVYVDNKNKKLGTIPVNISVVIDPNSGAIKEAKVIKDATTGGVTAGQNNGINQTLTQCPDGSDFYKVLTDPNCSLIAFLVNSIIGFISGVFEYILELALKFFDWIVKISIYEFKNLVDNTGIKEIWSSVIVVLLISLVFPLMLYLIFKSLFDNSLDPIQKTLPSLLVFSVFTYFSFTIVSALIDLSNVTSIYLYKALGGGENPSTEIVNKIIGNDGNKFKSDYGSYSTIVPNLAGLAVTLCAIWVFVQASIYIFTRALTFLIVLLFSPILLVPEGILKKIDEWKGTIKKNFMDGLFSAPLFFLIMFVAIQVASKITKLNLGSPSGEGGKDYAWVGKTIISIFVLVLFFFALKMIKEMSGIVGNFVGGKIGNLGKQAWGGIKKGAGKAWGGVKGLGSRLALRQFDKLKEGKGWISKIAGKQGSGLHKRIFNNLNKNSQIAQKRVKDEAYKESEYHKNLNEEGKSRNLKRIQGWTNFKNIGLRKAIAKKVIKNQEGISFEDKYSSDSKYKKNIDDKIINEKDGNKVITNTIEETQKHLGDKFQEIEKDLIEKMYHKGEKIKGVDGKDVDVKKEIDDIANTKPGKDREEKVKLFFKNYEAHQEREENNIAKKGFLKKVEEDVFKELGEVGVKKLESLRGKDIGRITGYDTKGEPIRDKNNTFDVSKKEKEISELRENKKDSEADIKQKELNEFIEKERGADTHKENLKNQGEETRHRETLDKQDEIINNEKARHRETLAKQDEIIKKQQEIFVQTQKDSLTTKLADKTAEILKHQEIIDSQNKIAAGLTTMSANLNSLISVLAAGAGGSGNGNGNGNGGNSNGNGNGNGGNSNGNGNGNGGNSNGNGNGNGGGGSSSGRTP